MNKQSLLDLVLDVLRKSGAEGDAYLEERRSLNLSVRDGKKEQISQATVRGLAVRAMHEGRLGFVHTSAVNEDGVRDAAEKAIALAQAASERDDLMIAEPAGPGDGSDEGKSLHIYDSSIENRTIDEKEEWIRSVESIARDADPKVTRTESAWYSDHLTGIWIANTKGLFRHYRQSRLEVGIEVVAEEADEKQVGGTGAEVARWEDLPTPDKLGGKAAERATKLLGGRPVETGRYPIVWSPYAGWALLVYIATALNGSHLSRKRSWLADRAGETIGSHLVTVHDNARLTSGPSSIPFDSEGVDTRDIPLIESGKITGNLSGLASAQRLGAASTGSARRNGYEQLPEISSSNLFLAPGNIKPEELVAKVDNGLWVWGLSGWWIGLDPSNPEFSSAVSGLWVENGKPTKPVARVTIAGGIEEILGGIEEVADDLVWNYPTKAPTFRVASMSVSGV